MLELKNINKSYKTGNFIQHALKNVDLSFRKNEFVAILGPSGSGKTTLLNIIGGLDDASMQHLQELAINSELTANQGMPAFIDKLSVEQIIFFGKWSLLFMSITSIVMYLLMLWVPEIICCSPNPLIALCKSLCKLFKDFFVTVRMFLILWFVGFVLLFINTFAVINPIAYIIMSIIMFYFSLYLVVLVFLYFDRKYVDADE